MLTKYFRAVALTAISTLFATGLAVPAQAYSGDADSFNDMISEVVAEEHQVTAPLENIKFEDEIVAIGESTLVSLPTELSPQLNLESLDDEKSLAIDLPDTVNVGTAQTSADGTIVHYEGSEETNYGIITHHVGTSVLLSIESEEAAEAYPFELSAGEEMELDLLDDGSVEIWLGGEAVGSISSPWAYDANGAPVSTYFTVENGTLTQHVEHVGKGHAYPIIADPDWVWYLKRAGQCASAIIGLSIADAATVKITAAMVKAFKSAKSGTSLYRAYQAWKELGKLDGSPLKTLLGVIKSYAAAFAKNIGKGFKAATTAATNEVKKGATKKTLLALIVHKEAADAVGNATGLKNCVRLVTGK